MKITDKITITNEDNITMMSRYPDAYFDLAIVDLEYCIGASKPTLKNKKVKQKNGTFLPIKQTKHIPKDWDFKMSNEEYFKELFRVSKKQIIFGGNYYGLKGGYLVWDKLNGETDQFGCEMAWLSFSKRTDIVYFLWSGMFQGQYCGKNIHKALVQQGNKSLNEKRIHPTQKPVKIYKYILQNYARPSYKILDTHHGSGSLAEACFDYDFELVACEKEENIYNDCINKIKQHTSQQKLF
jgi:site-specific DNA-methyltransferase (adenine-specific)